MSTRSGFRYRKSILVNVNKPKIRINKHTKMAALTPEKIIDIVAKIMPNDYNGSPLMLSNTIDKLEILRDSVNHAENQKLLISLIKAKFCSKARDALGDNIETIDDVITALKENCKGQSSWQIATTLEGIRVGNRAKYVTDLTELTEKLKHAFILEGTSKDAANKYSINAVTKNIRMNYANNPVMVSSMTGDFDDMNEVIHKFESIQIEKEASVLLLRNNQPRNQDKFYRGRNYRNINSNISNSNNYNNNSYGNSGGKRYQGNRYRNYNRNSRGRSGFSSQRNIRAITVQGNEQCPEMPGSTHQNMINSCQLGNE